ncbi:hypothetical protein Ccar_03865 [Clostridium carboxidivorans P7]|uniref:Phosphomevalonate dehydratase large subunit-like domain-containing protein n=1 Tax=Clostridium carboxidivorans P7 TaxID=536227 RepID=C6PRY7_9CLOT|nr:aconitase X [Clostridium carboxidivorans]AKN30009.1 hypothetical protein Ccar_03865 [Clostridium carboxidivorans P7]EET88039.1 protein of unknown function DUF521 [Clostridium carboxidivorans P7]EFG89004.1 hypothetical protein CLCAR_1186 [Clostridium carboxidivorans P7]
MEKYNMELTLEEKEILDGKQGKVMKKILESVVLYGEAFGAKRLLPIEGPAHIVTSFGRSGLDTVFDIMDEIIQSGIKVKHPFTVDPKPMDYENIEYTEAEKEALLETYCNQDRYIKQLEKLGLKNSNAFTCTCYMKEVGNRPKMGQVISWAESSAVVYANSVLGARTNRNSGVIELLCALIGKVPEFGLVTNEGRKAKWLIEVRTSTKPNAHLLGSAIGMKVVEEVPYIIGLDKFLGNKITPVVSDYLKDMGASSASNGAVGLYHVENITPEAADEGRGLLVPNYKTYVIDDSELERVMKAYPMMWKDINAKPDICLIGCPHLSLEQIYEWVENISKALKSAGKEKVALTTYLSAAPDVINKFKEDEESYNKLLQCGLTLNYLCPLMYLGNTKGSKQFPVTNSNKLRTYSKARFFLDDEILKIIVSGSI